MTRFAYRELFLVLCLTCGTAATAQVRKEVKLSELFGPGGLGADVIVQVPDSLLLVLDAGVYKLENRNLILRAKYAKVSGLVVIESYSKESEPPVVEGTPPVPADAELETDGTDGNAGSKGRKGGVAGIALLEIGSLSSDPGSNCSISLRGQRGGQGQMGGQGGRGGKGRNGGDADASVLCTKPCPDAGSPGRPGGRRGAGGVGGDGGDGGKIFASSAVRSALASGLVKLDTLGGSKGNPGAVGQRGIGGPPGVRGSGSAGCECKDIPPPAADGPAGPDNAPATPSGISGKTGSIEEI